MHFFLSNKVDKLLLLCVQYSIHFALCSCCFAYFTHTCAGVCTDRWQSPLDSSLLKERGIITREDTQKLQISEFVIRKQITKELDFSIPLRTMEMTTYNSDLSLFCPRVGAVWGNCELQWKVFTACMTLSVVNLIQNILTSFLLLTQ